ncbi:MAG: response regulator receiver protein [Myxococcales bacterium]|nr:response regulator receiver protein [Myxococcales bacterium]
MERVHEPASAGAPPSILIIDDDIDTHEALAELLEHAGYSVVLACNGREALKTLATMRPSMILLDVEMPVMNGPEFRQAQRRDQDLITIPTVVMTGSREEPVLDPGVADVLRKPFRSAQLIETVRRHCHCDAKPSS